MFAPNHAQAAAELARVCRPGGRIGLASWTPDGFIGQMLKVVGTHVPPVPGVSSPLLWGSEPYVHELLGDTLDAVVCNERTFTFRFRSAHAFVDFFRTYCGPTVKAFEAAGTDGDALFADLAELVQSHAGKSTGPLTIPATWLETVAIRSNA
jgi:SAM-dependent methyltransferase